MAFIHSKDSTYPQVQIYDRTTFDHIKTIEIELEDNIISEVELTKDGEYLILCHQGGFLSTIELETHDVMCSMPFM
jgi:hypothetical protein